MRVHRRTDSAVRAEAHGTRSRTAPAPLGSVSRAGGGIRYSSDDVATGAKVRRFPGEIRIADAGVGGGSIDGDAGQVADAAHVAAGGVDLVQNAIGAQRFLKSH